MVSGVVLTGGTNRLQLTPGGKVYVPGDTVPVTAAQLRSLKAMGLRFEVTKAEPPPKQEPPKEEPPQETPTKEEPPKAPQKPTP